MRRHQSLLRVSISVPGEAEEAAVELLSATCGQSASSYVDAETTSCVISVYLEPPHPDPSPILEALRAGLKRIANCGLDTLRAVIEASRIRKEDWADAWKRHFKTIQVGKALLIKPSWIRRKPLAGQALVILDPGLSFGTGQHPTTRFCLGQLVLARKRGAKSLLDIGTGSGILAIAASKLGYKNVEAFDFDPESVRVARANAKSNSVDGRVTLQRQDLTRLPLGSKKRFDVVCANLISDLLIREKDRIIRRLAPHGTLVLAGILETQFAEVESAFAGCGFKLVSSKSAREWKSGAFRNLR